MTTRFVIASSALGEREEVHVFVYPTRAEMIAAGTAFNAIENPPTTDGITQAYTDDSDRTLLAIVRLHQEVLGSRVLSHEIHHAATAIYGAHVGDRISRRAHLNHWNEPFAHLYSDLFSALVNRLHALGLLM